MTIAIESALMMMGVPSAVTGMCFWFLQHNISKREKVRDEKEQTRDKSQIFLIQSIGASLALSEATARALQDGKCNGEMITALNYAKKIKQEHKDFMAAQSVKSMH